MASSFSAVQQAIKTSGVDTGKSTEEPLSGEDGMKLIDKLLRAAKSSKPGDLQVIAQVFTASVTIALAAIAKEDDGPGFNKLEKLQRIAKSKKWEGQDFSKEMVSAKQILSRIGESSGKTDDLDHAATLCQKLAHEARSGQKINVHLMSKIVAALRQIHEGALA